MHQWKGEFEWEEIRILGSGGQSKVFLVRNSKRIEERKKYLSKLIELSSQGFNEVRAQQFVEATLGYGREEHSAELGALKIYDPRAAGPAAEQQALERLKVEIHVLDQKRLGLPRLLDFNESEKWIVTEFYVGGTLEDNLFKFKGNPFLALTRFRQLVETVAGLHKDSIIHRDIKPANVFTDYDGNVVLGDFGIAFLPDRAERCTFTNENVGPRHFMPPWAETEMRLEDITPQFDVYMLGKLLWCMVAGRLKLLRELYTRADFNLTEKFPGDPNMYAINSILGKCLHETPEKCLPDAGELLMVVNAHLDVMRRSGQMLVDGVPRPCRICGQGSYLPVHNMRGEYLALESGEVDVYADSSSIGYHDQGKIYVQPFECNNCKHVELFRFR